MGSLCRFNVKEVLKLIQWRSAERLVPKSKLFSLPSLEAFQLVGG